MNSSNYRYLSLGAFNHCLIIQISFAAHSKQGFTVARVHKLHFGFNVHAVVIQCSLGLNAFRKLTESPLGTLNIINSQIQSRSTAQILSSEERRNILLIKYQLLIGSINTTHLILSTFANSVPKLTSTCWISPKMPVSISLRRY